MVSPGGLSKVPLTTRCSVTTPVADARVPGLVAQQPSVFRSATIAARRWQSVALESIAMPVHNQAVGHSRLGARNSHGINR